MARLSRTYCNSLPIGESLHFAMKRKRDFFNLVPWVFSQHPMHAKTIFLQEEKLMLGVIQAITSHFQELKKIETCSRVLKPRFLKYWVVYSMRDRLLEDRARPNHRKILMLLDPHSYLVGLHKSALCSISDHFPPSWIRLRTKMVDRRFTTFTRFHIMGYCFDARHTLYKGGYSYVCYGFIK